MATVDAEKKLQKRVLGWLVNDLGYTYLGNLEDVDNTCRAVFSMDTARVYTGGN